MRKILLFLGRIPSAVRKAAQKALVVTTQILKLLESSGAVAITDFIPGTLDNELRVALIAILKTFQPALQAVKDQSARKALAARIGAEITAKLDGNQHNMGQYSIWFEQVYQEGKA